MVRQTKISKLARENYLGHRVTHGVRDSIQLTAIQMKLTPEEICDLIGMGKEYASPKVEEEK